MSILGKVLTAATPTYLVGVRVYWEYAEIKLRW